MISIDRERLWWFPNGDCLKQLHFFYAFLWRVRTLEWLWCIHHSEENTIQLSVAIPWLFRFNLILDLQVPAWIADRIPVGSLAEYGLQASTVQVAVMWGYDFSDPARTPIQRKLWSLSELWTRCFGEQKTTTAVDHWYFDHYCTADNVELKRREVTEWRSHWPFFKRRLVLWTVTYVEEGIPRKGVSYHSTREPEVVLLELFSPF